MMMRRQDIVSEGPEIPGGTTVFVGTRVPVQSLLDYLRGGDTLDQFLQDFPSVRRGRAEAVLDLAKEALTSGATPS